jgi:hypothetical protein
MVCIWIDIPVHHQGSHWSSRPLYVTPLHHVNVLMALSLRLDPPSPSILSNDLASTPQCSAEACGPSIPYIPYTTLRLSKCGDTIPIRG